MKIIDNLIDKINGGMCLPNRIKRQLPFEKNQIMEIESGLLTLYNNCVNPLNFVKPIRSAINATYQNGSIDLLRVLNELLLRNVDEKLFKDVCNNLSQRFGYGERYQKDNSRNGSQAFPEILSIIKKGGSLQDIYSHLDTKYPWQDPAQTLIECYRHNKYLSNQKF